MFHFQCRTSSWICLHPAKMNCGMTPAGVCAGEQPVGGERAAHSASSHRPGRDGNVRESWRLQDRERRKSTHLIKLIIYQIRRDRLRWSDGLRQHCPNKNVGGRKGWRLPSFPELASLIDPSNANPTLPTGHPFTNVQSAHYWSATADAVNPTVIAWLVDFSLGVGTGGKEVISGSAWCVRGPMNADTY